LIHYSPGMSGATENARTKNVALSEMQGWKA